jgi:coenzyme F420-reducing hydrogenase alpha subunit
MKINVHHLTRVEGHGNINIEIKDDELKSASWEVVETPRYFEAMLQGKSIDVAHALSARICGICSIGHALASLRAIENALDIKPSKKSEYLRLLAKHGETIQSHVLHIFFLAAPDFFSTDNVIPILTTYPEIGKAALQLKKLGNEICDVIGGRTTHPVRFRVGGFSKFPLKEELAEFQTRLNLTIADFEENVKSLANIKIPEFVRETEHISLKGDKYYPFIGGDLISSDGIIKKENEYLQMTNEYVVESSTSKWCKLSRKSFAVGALARFNNNYDLIHPKAKAAAEYFKLKPVCHNPYMITIAQIIECIHVAYDSIDLINKILDIDIKEELKVKYSLKDGEGVGAVEVPRGILYHHYTVKKDGCIIKANCIIPTTQNNANIHYDLIDLVKKQVSAGNSDENKIKKLAEMLVRAYDPCISCSVH